MTTDVPIADVLPGTRHRKDLGDLKGLTDSMNEIGLLQPIGLAPDGSLVFGGRRLAAAKLLGWETIPARVIVSLADAVTALKAERDENKCRLDMKPSELVAIGKTLEGIERANSEKRQVAKLQQNKGSSVQEPVPERSGQTRDIVGEALGVSGKTYEQSKTVVDEGTPELVAAMDDGKIAVKDAAKVAKMPKATQKKVAKADRPKRAAKEAIAKDKAKKKSPEPEPPAKDALGAAIPRGLADTFGDPTLAECIARIDAAHREIISVQNHVTGTLSRKGEFWPYALFGECAKSLATAADRIAEAGGQLSCGVPYCICPLCKGSGCKECRNSGAWPQHRYDNRSQYGAGK